MTWEEEAQRAGIPTDRIGLVKRNIELKTKLESAIKTIKSMGNSVHETFHHQKSWDNCDEASCDAIKKLMRFCSAD